MALYVSLSPSLSETRVATHVLSLASTVVVAGRVRSEQIHAKDGLKERCLFGLALGGQSGVDTLVGSGGERSSDGKEGNENGKNLHDGIFVFWGGCDETNFVCTSSQALGVGVCVCVCVRRPTLTVSFSRSRVYVCVMV